MPENREALPDQEARPAAKAIAKALYHWTHDCNRMGHGVITCGGCQVELNGFANRDGDGLAEDLRLWLTQAGWLVVPVSDVSEAQDERHAYGVEAQERARLLEKWSETDALWIEAKAEVARLRSMVERLADEITEEGMSGWSDNIRAELRGASDEVTR